MGGAEVNGVERDKRSLMVKWTINGKYEPEKWIDGWHRGGKGGVEGVDAV